jgi:hypothetical protein
MSLESSGSSGQSNSSITTAVQPTLIHATAGESPLDFIQKNLNRAKATQPIAAKEHAAVPLAEPVAVTPKVETPPAETGKAVLTSTGEVSFIPDAVKVEAAPQAPATALAPQASQEPNFESDDDIPPLEKNYKILRTKYKETAKSLKEIVAEKVALAQKIKNYDAGEEAPEYVTALKKRVAILEPLELVHNAKNSDAYKTRVIEPLNEKMTALKAVAKDYDYDENEIEQATNLSGRELNQFLLQHFDDVGALEAKQHITAIQKIRADALEIEKTPASALAKMEQEHAAIIEGRNIQRRNSIAETGKFAWRNAITKVIKEGRVAELIPRENDPEFNAKYPHAIQEKAAQDYGRIVRELADGGLKSLSPELGEALATASLLSIASAVAVERANAAERYASEVETNAARNNRYSRPNLGASGNGAQASSGTYVPKTTAEAARDLLNNVLSKR